MSIEVTVNTVELNPTNLNAISGELVSVFVEGDKVWGVVQSTEEDDGLSFYLPLKDGEKYKDMFEIGDDMLFYNYVGTVTLNGEHVHFVERATLPAPVEELF